MRKNGPFQDFFWLELCLDGLDGRSPERGDVGVRVAVGEAGGLINGGSRGVGLYDVGSGGSTVRIDALSSSEIPARVIRSEYALTIEFTREIDEVDSRMVSVSDAELIVDIVRSDAMLEARSEPEVDEPAGPKS